MLFPNLISSCKSEFEYFSGNKKSNINSLGPLLDADGNNVMLPEGFTSKIVAKSGQIVTSNSEYKWHGAPDGGATFNTDDNGWIYVCNAELDSNKGGVGALRFDHQGNLTNVYSILSGTNINCGGGKTPWNTWLSCEENGDLGRVFECDPWGFDSPIYRSALGLFNHEAIAVDIINNHLYLTEDRSDGCLYRFIPEKSLGSGYPDLSTGKLQIAYVIGGNEGTIKWNDVPDPSASSTPTRYQINEKTTFNGGEGISYFNGLIYFSTKFDNRIWCFDILSEKIKIFYDYNTSSTPYLYGVDNTEVSSAGDVLVAEDGGNLEIVALDSNGSASPIIRLLGHDNSEITGPALSPKGDKIYFSSQRGMSGESSGGITFEVTGPFFK